MKKEDKERFAESIVYQEELLVKFFAEYVGKVANDNTSPVKSQAA